MPARKAVRQASRRRDRNVALRSRAKTLVRNARRRAEEGDAEAAREALTAAVKSLDKAVQKGALHMNNAARRKSRLAKLVNGAGANSEE